MEKYRLDLKGLPPELSSHANPQLSSNMSIEERLGRIEERLERIENLLSLSVSQVVGVKQVAILLGRSESRIRHLVANREIPHYKNSRGQISFVLSEIEDWRKGV